MKRIKWPVEWNRPLSKEEREIAARLSRAPVEPSIRELLEERYRNGYEWREIA